MEIHSIELFKKVFGKACITLLLMTAHESSAQTSRIIDPNTICWLTSLNTISAGKKTSLHLEYANRRAEGITSVMQQLVRVGLNYRIYPKLSVTAGAAYFLTYPYNEYPSNNPAVRFPEKRLFEQINLNDSIKSLSIIHRFRLEQRWSGRMDSADIKKIADWSYSNRIRYLIRLTHPILQPCNGKGGLYAVAQNELFISFGKNVKSNIFNQNRLGLLIGTRLSKNLALECGYLDQIIEQGNLIENKPVFQYNKGFQASLILNK
jgi:hypothetical protein